MRHDDSPPINTGYVLGQLSRALASSTEHPDGAVRQRAQERLKRWKQVFQGMLTGAISVGSQTPVDGVPSWVTLEVMQGGFATGNLLASGPLQAHELALLERLQRPASDHARAALNLYYLGDPGQRELLEMLGSGCYRIDVPEEGALPVVAWLLAYGRNEEAQALIDAIWPFFDRLRFYPAPSPEPMLPSATVHRQTVGEAVDTLRRRPGQPHVERMMEALRVWQPMYDRAVSLFLETVEDGRPCRRFPDGWRDRARALLDDYARLREKHTLCGKPDHPKENFCRLRGYMKTCIEDPGRLSPRDLGMVRHILNNYVERHGAPGSEKFSQRRSAQAHNAGLPTHKELGNVLVARLKKFPGSGGVVDVEAVVSPIADQEAVEFKIPSGWPIPGPMAVITWRCWEAPIGQLVEKKIVPSGEVLAQVVSQITSQVKSAGIEDRDLRLLYGAVYSAFRRRRSLLLLNLASQARFEDLPWIAALKSHRHDDLNTREQAKQTLEQVATLAIVSFPQAILPNPLLREVHALVKAAGLPIPIVDEIAADIFMGEFAEKFLHAAQIAALQLGGSLYERYYGVPYERVLKMDDIQKRGEVPISPGFAALCEELARDDGTSRYVVRNGKVLEQSQILTTHNLAALFTALDLEATLAGRLRALSENCFRWICERPVSSSWRANLHTVKNSAYAWRQMVFFLALLDAEDVVSFLQWARGHLAEQISPFAQGLHPALNGLEWTASGGVFDENGTTPSGDGRRFLGWTSERHWMLGERTEGKKN